ncbi:MAG: GntR family transcriptional regulator [Syntrophobacterales bacterium]|nr:GntR family transcriptional regulator [Syntrophobacterales bacterium]
MSYKNKEQLPNKDRFLREQVYRQLKNNVLDGNWEPNTRLVEEKLAADMGTSRTPVREAIQKLEKEGLIQKLPRGGFAVGSVTAEEVEEVFEIRGILETHAAYLAAKRATERDIIALEEIVKHEEEALIKKNMEEIVKFNTLFHDTLYKTARSEKLVKVVNELRDFIHRYRVICFTNDRMAVTAVRDHLTMITAMKANNPKLVQKTMHKLFIRAKKFIKKRIRQHPRKRAAKLV